MDSEYQNEKSAYISQLNLTNFRNYSSKKLFFSNSPVLICGNNGIGKTNILEGISFLSPGRGLRTANLQEITNKNEKIIDANLWTVYGKIENSPEYESIGTGLQLTQSGTSKRVLYINNSEVKDKSTLNKIFNIIWLTPQDDSLFTEAPSVRRKFMDRIVYCLDPSHTTRVSKYERVVQERMKLLTEETYHDKKWVEVLEKTISEVGTEIAKVRIQTLAHLNKAFQSSIFPKEDVSIDGYFEKLISDGVEENKVIETYRQKLEQNRTQDTYSKKTNIGVHKSDLKVIYKSKNTEAQFCSTGEQKSLLISLTLAKARMCKMLNRPTPILLLDEIASHLDEIKRNELFHEISDLNTQCFLTGTDVEIFKQLNNAEFLSLSEINK